MRRFRGLRSRCRLEMAAAVVPLVAILVLQFVSSRRLARVEGIAHQTMVARYLEAVAADVRKRYEGAARDLLDVSGDALAEKRFEEIKRHFEGVDTSVARLLFAGTLHECWCLTHYYDPATGRMGVGADAGVERVVLRISTLLRAAALPQPEELRVHLDRNRVHVDEQDSENRAVYRFIFGADAGDSHAEVAVGVVGFIIDSRRFAAEYLPQAVGDAMDRLPADVQQNLIVRVADAADRVVTSTHDGPGQADVLTVRPEFVFRDWELSARSRHTAAAQVLASNAFTSWGLTVLMSVAVLGGVLLTWRALSRERRLTRIRNEFVANVSHELRSPIASLAVFGEFLRRGRVESPDKVVEYGRRIEHESDRLRHLIDNVLDLARIESVETRYRLDEAALEDVVATAINAVDARRERDDFTITVGWPDTLLPVVRIDAQAMTQVIVNLLDNAMKYSGRSRRIRVDLWRCENRVAVGVTDWGVGIAADDQERIFQQFYRTAAAVADRVSGTGLGLAIARHVVRAHGGSIEVASRPGCGARFTVLLPVPDAVMHRRSTRVSTAVEGVGLKAGAEA